jgi:hypothetical protein
MTLKLRWDKDRKVYVEADQPWHSWTVEETESVLDVAEPGYLIVSGGPLDNLPFILVKGEEAA